MGRALTNHRCCNEIKALNQMSNHRKCSTKGSKMILRSSLNAYHNAESFIESTKLRACKQCCCNHMAKSGMTPAHNAYLDVSITQNDVNTEDEL